MLHSVTTVISLSTLPQQEQLPRQGHISAGESLHLRAWIFLQEPSSIPNAPSGGRCPPGPLEFIRHNGNSSSSYGLLSESFTSEDIVFWFLSFLLHRKRLKVPTITVYYATLRDPHFHGFQQILSFHLMDLVWKSFFHQHPTSRPSHYF